MTLFAYQGARFPQWFTSVDWPVNVRIIKTSLFPADSMTGLRSFDMGNFSITISSPERAILEVLYGLPKTESPDQARHLMEGLATLRPDVVTELLRVCTSVKVKRTFMVLAEAGRHGWLERLDTSGVALGSGKRSLIRGGYLHPRYQITVPHAWKPGRTTDA